MTILLLVGCAAILSMLGSGTQGPSTEESDPYSGEPGCEVGPWVVSCDGCDPPWSRDALAPCVGDGPDGWFVLVLDAALQDLGGFEAARAAAPGEDWTVSQQ